MTRRSCAESDLVDDGTQGDVTAGDGIYTVVLSMIVGPRTSLPNHGLLTAGVSAEFILVVNGLEYRGSGFSCLTEGVGADLMPPGGAWAPTNVFHAASGNTAVQP